MSKRPDHEPEDHQAADSGKLGEFLRKKRPANAASGSAQSPEKNSISNPQAALGSNEGTLGGLLKEKRRVQSGGNSTTGQLDQSKRPKLPSHSNQPHAFPIGCWVLPLVFLTLSGALMIWASWPPVLTSSWINYETVMTDNLVHNSRKGFIHNFSDESWVDVYDQRGLNTDYDWVFVFEANGETANSFPGVSKLSAVGKKLVAEDDFFLATIAGLLLIIALTLLLNLVRLEFGWLAFAVALIAIILDGPIYQLVYLTGDRIVTALVILAFVFLTMGLKSNRESRRDVWVWPVAGALLGATTLFQFQTNVWLGFILAGWVVACAVHWVRHKSVGVPVESFVLFWIGVVVVASPWWIRNCQTTGELRPLGYAIDTYLENAYSDQAIKNNGNLEFDSVLKSRETTMMAMALNNDLTLAEKEAVFASQSKTAATQWASTDSAKSLKLIALRLASHFDLLNRSEEQSYFWRILFNPIWLIGALIGCCLNWRRWGALILGLVFTSAVVVGLTWSDHGRYLVPLRPLIDVGFAIGFATCFARLSQSRDAQSIVDQSRVDNTGADEDQLKVDSNES